MTPLNGNEAAEAPSEHEHGPQPQDAARDEKREADPAGSLAVDRPNAITLRVR